MLLHTVRTILCLKEDNQNSWELKKWEKVDQSIQIWGKHKTPRKENKDKK